MVSIIIPNYNGLEHLKTVIPSINIQSRKDCKIIIADNNSDDGSVEFYKDNYSDIKVLEQNYNTGFAKAVNTGIKYALNFQNPEFILLLNNDIECSENFIDEMLTGFISDETGSVACKMLNYYERNKIDDAGDFIKLIGSPFARGHAEIDNGQYDTPGFIFGACAGAAMYRAKVFNETGFFDEDFFAYNEDVDFSLRLQLQGFKCFYNPKAVCFHKRGATSGYSSGLQTMLCEKNLIAIRLKNYPASLYIKLSPGFAAGRIRRYYRFLRNQPFKIFLSAVRGYFKGLIQIPGTLKKRKQIQSNKKISNSEFLEIFKEQK